MGCLRVSGRFGSLNNKLHAPVPVPVPGQCEEVVNKTTVQLRDLSGYYIDLAKAVTHSPRRDSWCDSWSDSLPRQERDP
jgi:hypothetical protein